MLTTLTRHTFMSSFQLDYRTEYISSACAPLPDLTTQVHGLSWLHLNHHYSVCRPLNQDSPLSTTTNIHLILTFGCVFLESLSYTLAIGWSANHDFLTLRSELALSHQRCEGTIVKIKDPLQ
jgi:hypothetical protein